LFTVLFILMPKKFIILLNTFFQLQRNNTFEGQ
jgi:hypothetical protein